MTSRYKNQMAPQMLEIRGLSRGSVIESSRRNTAENTFAKGPQYMGLQRLNYPYDDDDESTLTGGSPRNESPPQSPVQSEDTITASGSGESSHYWSAGNSITTGNTTERSSVYSWGDDDFDHQASRMVRQMFQSIEKMLFESVLNESPYLQHECLEWMKAFPHLRILGKQTLPLREDGVYSLPPTAANSKVTTPSSSLNLSYSESGDGLSVSGNNVQVTNVPVHLLAQSLSIDSNSNKSVGGQGIVPPMGCDLTYLNEEILEQDGVVDEYLAYDSREFDTDEPTRRYHVPRRRRLGYPPITPNACVHDAVVNHLFDKIWSKLVKCITGGVRSKHSKTKNSIIKILFDNHQKIREMMQNEDGGQRIIYNPNNENYPQGYELHYGQNIPGIHIERGVSTSALPHNFGPNFSQMTIGNGSRLLFNDGGLPPSRGSYFDHGLNSGRNFHNSPMRLSTAPHGGDMSALNDVMKISQKKLQLRSDKINLGSVLPHEDPHQLFSTSPNAGNNMYSSLSSHNIFTMNVNGRPTSPFAVGGRSSFIGREYPSSGANTAMGSRQQSATVRKGRIGIGRPARLMPLDRPKTPKQFTGMLKAKKLHLGSAQGNYDGPSGVVGVRVHSPQGNPPPTAPAASSNLWSTPSRLPPISGLEALNEDKQTEFRRKNRMNHSRISSAVADVESQQNRRFDGMNRPNTTQAFRTDVMMGMKRATSVTPSNMTISNNAFGIIGGKNTSPAPGFSYPSITGSSSMFQQHTSNSPDNMTGLAGITGVGISMLGHSTAEREDDGGPWGHPYIRRKRTVVGT